MAALLVAVVLGLTTAFPHIAGAQSAAASSGDAVDARITAIEQQIQGLQEELERLKKEVSAKDEQLRQSREETRQAQEQAKAAVAKTESEKPLVSFPRGRPTISSDDGRYSLAIGALVQFDAGAYFQDSPNGTDNRQPVGARDLNNGENLRRGRIFIVGGIDDFTLRLTPDFGGSPDGSPTLFEANINYSGFKPVTATIGYFKPWQTLQDSMSLSDQLFIEAPSITEIARNVAAGNARASVGAKASGEDYFAAAYLTGGTYGAQSANLLNDEQTGATLRVATRPLRGEDWNTHIGISASKVFNLNENDALGPGNRETIELSDRPELRIDQNRLIDTGPIPAKGAATYGIELAANWRNFLIQGEYIRIDVDQDRLSGPSPSLTFDGGYAEGSWVITGESRPYVTSSAAYARPTPAHPFSLSDGGWGAWELAARYSIMNLDSHVSDGVSQAATGGVFGGTQQVYSLSLSWYPNDYLRFLMQFSHVDVDRLDATGTTQVGQDFQDISLRSQVAF